MSYLKKVWGYISDYKVYWMPALAYYAGNHAWASYLLSFVSNYVK